MLNERSQKEGNSGEVFGKRAEDQFNQVQMCIGYEFKMENELLYVLKLRNNLTLFQPFEEKVTVRTVVVFFKS